MTKKVCAEKIPHEVLELINRQNQLLQKDDEKSKDEVRTLDEEIYNTESEINRNKIMENFKSFSDNPENINLGQVWQTMKKLWPKYGATVPSAKKDHNGKIVTAPSKLKKLLAKEYKERLRTRPVRPDLDLLEERKR